MLVTLLILVTCEWGGEAHWERRGGRGKGEKNATTYIKPTILPPKTASMPPTIMALTIHPPPHHQSPLRPSSHTHDHPRLHQRVILPIPLLSRLPFSLTFPAPAPAPAPVFPSLSFFSFSSLINSRLRRLPSPPRAVATLTHPQTPTIPKQTEYEMRVQNSVNRQMSDGW